MKDSSSIKVVTDSGLAKGKVEKGKIDVNKETSSLFVLLDDELQSFSSKGKVFISSIMNFIVRKSFSKSLKRSPLKDVVQPSM